jgi:hypothetical protein
MVRYVLYPGAAPGGDSKRLDGGLFKTGYETLVIQPEVMVPCLDQKHPYTVWRCSAGSIEGEQVFQVIDLDESPYCVRCVHVQGPTGNDVSLSHLAQCRQPV